jgi:hypothetical protein
MSSRIFIQKLLASFSRDSPDHSSQDTLCTIGENPAPNSTLSISPSFSLGFSSRYTPGQPFQWFWTDSHNMELLTMSTHPYSQLWTHLMRKNTSCLLSSIIWIGALRKTIEMVAGSGGIADPQPEKVGENESPKFCLET